MEDFFRIVFGGLCVIGLCIGIAYGSGQLYSAASPWLHDAGTRSLSTLVSLAVPGPTDGTVISGLSRVIRYTAAQEENIVSDMAGTLLAGASNQVSAVAYEVKDLTTGTVAVEDNPDKLLPIASLTKLVTAVMAQRLISTAKRISISATVMQTYGNTASFKAGETFTAGDLLYPLLMVSSNDAAEALAQDYGRPQFIKAMNDFVQSIGAYRTSFADPSGLSPSNISTPNDMILILSWIRANDPSVVAITDTQTKTVRDHTWVNPTHFLSWSNYLGGKNGYTDEAKSTGASLFSAGRNNDIYAVVVLGSKDRDTDIVKLLGKVNGQFGLLTQ